MNQVTFVIGRVSFAPAFVVHVPPASSANSAFLVDGSSPFAASFQSTSQPLFAILGFAPEPVAGAFASVPSPASTKARKRPTVTSYLSSLKLETVAAFDESLLRLKVPPTTG